MSYQLYDVNGFVADLATTTGLQELLAYCREQSGPLKDFAEELVLPIDEPLLKSLDSLPSPSSETLKSTLASFVENVKKCKEVAVVGDGIGEAEEEAEVEAVHPHGVHSCVCSECGTTVEVEAGVECRTQSCPKCGGPMTAKTAGERRTPPQETSEPAAAEAVREVMKTEDSQEYPAEAFAYSPDSEQPSTWKLRLWESPTVKVTRAQLGRAAAALSPGGFRGNRVDLPKEAISTVKRKIRAAYRALDVQDEDIPRWVQEAVRPELVLEVTSLSEAAVTDKGIAQVVVIKPGFNASKERFYEASGLAQDFKLFEGAKMFADHAGMSEEKDRPERSIRDWVATLRNVHVDAQGRVVGEATVLESWLQQKLAALRDKGLLGEMGVSINAIGQATKAVVEGIKTNVIERITKVRSVDFVTWPGAGGMVTLYEADRDTDVDLVSLETLRERRPDLVRQVESEAQTKVEQEVKVRMGLQEQMQEAQALVEDLRKERDAAKAEKETAEKAGRIATATAAVREAVGKAQLPDASKARLIARFKDAESTNGVDVAIAEEATYVAAVSEAGKVRGLGAASKPTGEEAHKALKESFKRMGMTDEQAETAANGR